MAMATDSPPAAAGSAPDDRLVALATALPGWQAAFAAAGPGGEAAVRTAPVAVWAVRVETRAVDLGGGELRVHTASEVVGYFLDLGRGGTLQDADADRAFLGYLAPGQDPSVYLPAARAHAGPGAPVGAPGPA